MYLRHIQVSNLRLIRDLQLSFLDDRGEPRRWTVLIGKNGMGKTSILQAIALAAVGGLRVNQLAGATSASMRDRRHLGQAVEIEAEFGFGSLGDAPERAREYPGDSPALSRVLHSKVWLNRDSRDLRASSWSRWGPHRGRPLY
jgi:DNA repair exonuclease SbcCD ATPase subunit